MPAPKVRIITNGVSEGARNLGEALEALNANVSRVRVGAPKLPVRQNVKWGCFNLDRTDYGGAILNVGAGRTSLNKLECFRALRSANVPIPEFTTERGIADGWMRREDCRRVYERHVLSGSEGDGIRVVETAEDLTQAPLYTKGMRGVRREYRIHVFKSGGINRIFVQQKKRRAGFTEDENYGNTVRNLAHGWIFAHNDIVQPRRQTIDIAIQAVTALGLDFGAVDLIEMHEHALGSVVLEINCAPGLQGATCDFYAQAIYGLTTGVRDVIPTPPPEPDHVVNLPRDLSNSDDDEDYTDDDDEY
jgi:hypothetical protein